MTVYGVTATGVVPKPLRVILEEIEADQRTLIDPNFDNGSNTFDGQNNGIFAGQLAEAWEALATLDSQSDPDNAEGKILDGEAALTGTLRKAPQKSIVTVTLAFDGSLPDIAIGSIVSDPAIPSHRWLSLTRPDTSGGGGTADIVFQAENAGPIQMGGPIALDIVTPISGWLTATSTGDATPGADIETDTKLRIRREEELRAIGNASEPSIKADILVGLDTHVPPAPASRSVVVLDNDTDVIDANGLPPHSIEAIVYDGTADGSAVEDNYIADLIYRTKAGGIQAVGNDSGDVTANGVVKTLGFSRPTAKSLYVDLDIKIDDTFPTDGDSQIIALIAAFGFAPSADVIALRLRSLAFGVSGVTDVPTFRLGFSPSPGGTINLAIALREIATLDAGNITVNHV